MEKQELEGRAFAAERTVVELEHTVTVLQRQLQDASCSLAQAGENQQLATLAPQPSSPTQSSSRDRNIVKVAKLIQNNAMVCLSKIEGQLTERKQDLSPTTNRPETDSHQSMLQFPEASTTDKNHRSAASGDEHASIHKDDDDHVHKRVQEEDTLSIASTLSMIVPLNLRSRDNPYEFLDHPSVNQEPNITDLILEKFEVENLSGSSNDASLLSGEECKENESHECVTNKPTDSTYHNISQKPEPAAGTTKSIRNPQLISLVSGGILEADSLSFSTVYKCDDPVALKTTISQIFLLRKYHADLVFCKKNQKKLHLCLSNLYLQSRQRRRNFSLEKNEANVQLPSTFINSSEMKTNSI
ncbi:hypothetical protein E2320_007027 [Naja naja]|nr:hypothetical protein E2320_007027 [Naja naja]